MKKKKIFVAIPITKEWEDILTNYSKDFSDVEWLKWEPAQKLHVTVLFVGETDEELIPEIEDALVDIVMAQQPFSLTLEKICYAPIEQRASMIWAKWSHQPEFSTLHARVREELSYIVGKVDADPALPHTTLARFDKKLIGPKELVPLTNSTAVGGEMEVEDVFLMETVMTQTGSTFRVLNKWKLGEVIDIEDSSDEQVLS